MLLYIRLYRCTAHIESERVIAAPLDFAKFIQSTEERLSVFSAESTSFTSEPHNEFVVSKLLTLNFEKMHHVARQFKVDHQNYTEQSRLKVMYPAAHHRFSIQTVF
jgi:anti-sigma-K factor RskA